jgi:hypothetical protein
MKSTNYEILRYTVFSILPSHLKELDYEKRWARRRWQNYRNS